MSEIGKEAVALALDVVSRAKFTGGPDEFHVLAEAFQKLVIQRDSAEKRAEAAERTTAEMVRRLKEWAENTDESICDDIANIMIESGAVPVPKEDA